MIGLSRREKYAVCTAAAAIFLFLILQFAVFPLIEKRERLERGRSVKAETLREIRILKTEYDTLKERSKNSRDRIEEKEKGFTLFSFLDQLAGKAEIKDRITYMKPSTITVKDRPFKVTKVEMKLSAVPLEKLVRYLYMVETSENRVDVRRISLSRVGKEKKYLDAVLEIETLSL